MSRALVVLNGPVDREKAIHWVNAAPSGTFVEFKTARRSSEQNARLWACLTEIARKVEWHGLKLPADDWKDIFTAALRKHRFVPGLEPNTVVPLGMRTSDMSKEEFGDLLDLIGAFAAERNIEFNEPSAADPTADAGGSRLTPSSPGPAQPDPAAAGLPAERASSGASALSNGYAKAKGR